MPVISKTRMARLLGTFFHDIGKFHYRAESVNADHAEKSGYFLREYFGRFRGIPKDVLEEAIQIAERHHYDPTSPVKEADHLAAEERTEDNISQALRPLFSIFQNIDIGKGPVPKGTFYYKPDPISITNVFPETTEDSPDSWKPDKNTVRSWHFQSWRQFLEEIKAIPQDLPFPELFDTLYYVMEKYTSRVTSAGYKSVPDISLFDHSRVVAAYADCIEESTNEDEPFLVIEGDVSGIQSFIYEIVNPRESDQSGSSKLLRGRSLFVKLLSDSVAQYILSSLNLFRIHLLLNGGGNFHIIAPNTEENQKKLKELERELNQWFLQEFQGKLGVVLASDTFSKNDIPNYQYIKQQLIDQLTKMKNKKYFSLLDHHEILFGPFIPESESGLDVCHICGSDFHRGETRRTYCGTCSNMMKVGQRIPYSKYFLVLENVTKRIENGEIPSFYLNGTRQQWFFLKDANELELMLPEFKDGINGRIFEINETDFLSSEIVDLYNRRFSKGPLQFGYKFIGQYTPTNEKQAVKSFEDLANEGPSYPYLHVIRMDVDSLGKIFIEGITNQSYTMARIANISRELDLFFTGYLNELARKYNIYITYSGGDDLFVVGHWEQALKFAMEVRKDFARMVCGNPNITISGGSFLMRKNFPIRRAAELCGEREHDAKDKMGSTKNCLSIFKEVLPWSRMEEIISWAEDVRQIIEKNSENRKYRSLIRYAKSLHDKYFDEEEEEDVEWIHKIRHKLYYMLARRANIDNKTLQKMDKIDEEEEREFIKTFSQLLDPALMENIVAAATYILLSTRQKRDN